MFPSGPRYPVSLRSFRDNVASQRKFRMWSLDYFTRGWAVYYFDPDMPLEFSTILLSADIQSSPEAVTWEVDGLPFATVGPPYTAAWKLQPGQHRISIRIPSGKANATSVRIRVDCNMSASAVGIILERYRSNGKNCYFADYDTSFIQKVTSKSLLSQFVKTAWQLRGPLVSDFCKKA